MSGRQYLENGLFMLNLHQLLDLKQLVDGAAEDQYLKAQDPRQGEQERNIEGEEIKEEVPRNYTRSLFLCIVYISTVILSVQFYIIPYLTKYTSSYPILIPFTAQLYSYSLPAPRA